MEVKKPQENYSGDLARKQSAASDLKNHFSVLDDLAEKIDELHNMRDEKWMKFADLMVTSGAILPSQKKERCDADG